MTALRIISGIIIAAGAVALLLAVYAAVEARSKFRK